MAARRKPKQKAVPTAKTRSRTKTAPRAQAMLKQIPARRYGLISSKALTDVVEIFDHLPDLRYPIQSAGEFVEKLGGPGRSIEIFGIPVSATALASAMPSHYFPIASLENLVEKMATLLRRNRRSVNLAKELGRVRPHLPKMRFPIRTADDLLAAFKSVTSIPATSPRLPPQHRRSVDGARVRQWITRHMGPDVFPIETEEDLYRKALWLIPRSSHLRG